MAVLKIEGHHRPLCLKRSPVGIGEPEREEELEGVA